MNRVVTESDNIGHRATAKRNEMMFFNMSEGGSERTCRCGMISDGFNINHKCTINATAPRAAVTLQSSREKRETVAGGV